MTIHSAKTKSQRQFLVNTDRAFAAGVKYDTAHQVRQALFSGLSYCNFGHTIAGLTDEYLDHLTDELWNRAHDQLVDCSKIKWVGFET